MWMCENSLFVKVAHLLVAFMSFNWFGIGTPLLF
jgi:hypothetical protein